MYSRDVVCEGDDMQIDGGVDFQDWRGNWRAGKDKWDKIVGKWKMQEGTTALQCAAVRYATLRNTALMTTMNRGTEYPSRTTAQSGPMTYRTAELDALKSPLVNLLYRALVGNT